MAKFLKTYSSEYLEAKGPIIDVSLRFAQRTLDILFDPVNTQLLGLFNRSYTALIDTGATHTWVSCNIYKEFKKEIVSLGDDGWQNFSHPVRGKIVDWNGITIQNANIMTLDIDIISNGRKIRSVRDIQVHFKDQNDQKYLYENGDGNVSCILGRDILRLGLFILDGTEGLVYLRF